MVWVFVMVDSKGGPCADAEGRTESSAPTEIIAAGSILPDAAVIAAGVGGTHRSRPTVGFDTGRRLSDPGGKSPPGTGDS